MAPGHKRTIIAISFTLLLIFGVLAIYNVNQQQIDVVHDSNYLEYLNRPTVAPNGNGGNRVPPNEVLLDGLEYSQWPSLNLMDYSSKVNCNLLHNNFMIFVL